MKGINFGRVILGGIVAGILINISEFLLNEKVLKDDWVAALKAMGKSMSGDSATLLVWVLYGFVLGIAAVWLYAAIRPRYGAGAGTAARAGVAVWFFTWLLSMVAMQNMGVFPIAPVPFVWTLVECIVATVAGAWLYKEAGA